MHLFQSSFLQALGYALANSLWQTALVWLIYMSVTGLISMSAAAKYRFAVTAQLTGFVWFLITFQFYYRQYNHAWQQSGANQLSQQIQTIVTSNTDFSSQLINWMVKGEQFLPYLSLAYLLLMAFLATRWLLGYHQTQIIRNSGLQKIPSEWRLFVKKIASQLDIKKEIRIFLSENITTPLTIGFLKPVILIPIASINHLTTDQLEAILLHELAHIKRYDYLINILLSVVEISLFFNPFTQLLSRHIGKERENSCDDWVLQFQYNASVYAEALLRIAYLQTSPSFAMAASGKKKNELLLRVKRMIDKKENRFSYRKQLLALVIVTGIISSIAWLNPIRPYSNPQSNSSAQNIVQKKVQPYAVEPMAVSVDNPLFNPVFFLSKPLKEEMKRNIASAQKEIAETIAGGASEGAGGLIESIPPMVAGALKMAAAEMSAQKPDYEKQVAELETAKLNLERSLHTDSLFMAPQMRAKIKEDISRSMKGMDTELKKAKLELERAVAMNAEVLFNKEKVQQDIRKAIESIEKLNEKNNLEKIVLNALKIPGLVFDEKRKHKEKTEAVAPVASEPEEITIPDSDKDLNESLHKEATIDDEITIAAPTIAINPIELRGLTRNQLQMLKLISIKLMALKDSQQVKLIPVLIRDRRNEERKIFISLQ